MRDDKLGGSFLNKSDSLSIPRYSAVKLIAINSLSLSFGFQIWKR